MENEKGPVHDIGVIVPTTDPGFFGAIARGIEEVVVKANYKIVICQTYNDPEKEISAIDRLLGLGVHGILVAPSTRTEKFDHLLKAQQLGVPVVLFDRSAHELDMSHVIIDDYRGGYKAVEHLISQGCRRIAHLTHPAKINVYKERRRGYEDALRKYGLPLAPELVVESNLQFDDGKISMHFLLGLTDPPDAVFSASDLGALGVLHVLQENTIKVPQQVAVVGFCNEPFTRLSDPPLTSIDPHCRRIGNLASGIFLDEVKAKQTGKIAFKNIMLMPELVIRQSSRRSDK